MIRYFTFAFVLLAMLLASTIAHAQQGNLPVPIQKLPSYPPVVCVTPNWTPESCASRAPTYGPQNELSGWQCGNVRVIMSSDSTTSSMEFLITGTEQRDNRFKLVKGEKLYLNGKLCTSLSEPKETQSLPPYPPVTCLKLDGTPEPCESRKPAPPAPADEQAVKCLKPDGTEESCASRQSYFEPTKRYDAEGLEIKPQPVPTTVIRHDGGGFLHEYVDRWSTISAQGGQVEVLGRCASACTLVTAYIPKDRLCFGPDASLDFHMARKSKTDASPAPEGTQWMLERYPADIRNWIADQGRYRMLHDWNVTQGSETPPRYGYWTLPAEELWKMGYRRCNG
jgi:hypothetical protein